MSFKDNLRKKLNDEVFQQVTDALGDDFNYDLVPRSRLNKVIKQRDALKEVIEGGQSNSQIDPSNSPDDDGSSGGKNSEDTFTMPKGKQQNAAPTLEDIKRTMNEQHQTEIKKLKIHFAGVDALRAASAVDPELVFTLLDQDKLTLGEDGKLTGIDDQLTTIKEARPYLFTQQQNGRSNTPGGTGKTGGSDPFETVKNKEDFLKLSYTDQLKFKDSHPDVFKSYLGN